MSERITELETQIAFQESSLSSLHEVITDQQKQIDALKEQVEFLKTQLQAVAESVTRSESEEPPPPHY